MGSLWQQQNFFSREKDIILGTVLGDGHIAMLKTGARLELTHSNKQKAYLFWKHQQLRRIAPSKPYRVETFDSRYQKGYIRWRLNTKVNKFFAELRNLFYLPSGRKIVPNSIGKILKSPLSLAVWFMDDGGRRNDCYGLFLNTLSFTRSEHEILRNCLKQNFALDCRIHWVQDGYRLYIPSKDSKRFCELVYPHIIPPLSYKLPYNPVTTSFARLDRARDRRN